MVIDLGNYKNSETIPPWIGDSLLNLVILILRSNHIEGNLPAQLYNLVQVQVLHISDNNIFGRITKCLDNLLAMVQTESPNTFIKYFCASTKDKGFVNIRHDYTDEARLV